MSILLKVGHGNSDGNFSHGYMDGKGGHGYNDGNGVKSILKERVDLAILMQRGTWLY